jgi:hypothetical protein
MTATKILLRLFLLFCVVFLVASGGVVAQEEQETVSVSTPEDLDAVRDDLDGDYALAGDIDMSREGRFDPVGSRNGESFTGSFDGNGHVITGLTVMNPGGEGVGLFGAVGEDGVVTDLGLEGIEVEGGDSVGGIVGFNEGNVTRSYVEGTVSGRDDYVGGVVGWNRGGLVSRSYSKAEVSGSLQVGGVVGRNDGGGTVEQIYAADGVSATAVAGGLVGMLGSENQIAGRETVLRGSYWDTEATGQSEAYGNMRMGDGDVTVENVEGLTTSEMQGDDARSNMSAFDFGGTWDTTDEYPALSWQTGVLPGDGTPLPGFGVFAGVFALLVALLLRAEPSRTDNS